MKNNNNKIESMKTVKYFRKATRWISFVRQTNLSLCKLGIPKYIQAVKNFFEEWLKCVW